MRCTAAKAEGEEMALSSRKQLIETPGFNSDRDVPSVKPNTPNRLGEASPPKEEAMGRCPEKETVPQMVRHDPAGHRSSCQGVVKRKKQWKACGLQGRPSGAGNGDGGWRL